MEAMLRTKYDLGQSVYAVYKSKETNRWRVIYGDVAYIWCEAGFGTPATHVDRVSYEVLGTWERGSLYVSDIPQEHVFLTSQEAYDFAQRENDFIGLLEHTDSKSVPSGARDTILSELHDVRRELELVHSALSCMVGTHTILPEVKE